MKTLPTDVKAYKRTPEFDQSTVPEGIRRDHRTKSGVWGKIVVLSGELDYVIHAPEHEVVRLRVGQHGVVEPEVWHHVRPVGEVRFYVEFYR